MSLSFEVVNLICTFVHQDNSSSRADRQKTLWSCCLVSRSWHVAAAVRLYEWPILDPSNVVAFLRSVCPDDVEPIDDDQVRAQLSQPPMESSRIPSRTASALNRPTKQSNAVRCLDLRHSEEISVEVLVRLAATFGNNLRSFAAPPQSDPKKISECSKVLDHLFHVQHLDLSRWGNFRDLYLPMWENQWTPGGQTTVAYLPRVDGMESLRSLALPENLLRRYPRFPFGDGAEYDGVGLDLETNDHHNLITSELVDRWRAYMFPPGLEQLVHYGALTTQTTSWCGFLADLPPTLQTLKIHDRRDRNFSMALNALLNLRDCFNVPQVTSLTIDGGVGLTNLGDSLVETNVMDHLTIKALLSIFPNTKVLSVPILHTEYYGRPGYHSSFRDWGNPVEPIEGCAVEKLIFTELERGWVGEQPGLDPQTLETYCRDFNLCYMVWLLPLLKIVEIPEREVLGREGETMGNKDVRDLHRALRDRWPHLSCIEAGVLVRSRDGRLRCWAGQEPPQESAHMLSDERAMDWESERARDFEECARRYLRA